MDQRDVLQLIAQGEGQRLEFKESVAELDRVIQTLSAFANTNPDGGCVIIGIGDKGKVKEVMIGKETIKQIADKISAHTDPILYPKIEVVKESANKGIIIVTLEGSSNRPHLAFGRAYKRVGSTTTQMTRDEYERLLLARHASKLQFDSQVCEGATLEDIDEEKVRWFLRKAKHERGLDIGEETPVDEALLRLKLLRDGRPTNAAVLLFTRDPQRFFIQSEVKGIRFKGVDVTGEMIDLRVIEGDVFNQLTETEKFIFNNIAMRAWIEEGKIERQEKWEYPPKAIRESLANAICHRDYKTTSKVQVRIFDDRIEFWNPGRLPEGWTVETLKQKHESMPPNPSITKQFFWVKYIEEVGTGTNKIIKWANDWGLPEPDFEFTGTSLIVTFRKSKLTEEYLSTLGLNEKQGKAVEHLKLHGKITTREYQGLTGISKTPAIKELNDLLSKGIITRIGKGRITYYILQESFSKRTKKERIRLEVNTAKGAVTEK